MEAITQLGGQRRLIMNALCVLEKRFHVRIRHINQKQYGIKLMEQVGTPMSHVMMVDFMVYIAHQIFSVNL